MKIKLYWKLTFIFCLAAMAGLAIGYFFLTSRLENTLEDNLKNDLKGRLWVTRQLLESHLDNPSREFRPDPVAEELGRMLGVRMTIIGQDGVVIGDSDVAALQLDQVENHGDRPEVQDALREGLGFSKRYSYTLKKYLIYMAVPFGDDKKGGVLRLAIPIKDVDLVKGDLQKTIALALLLVLVLSLALVYVVSFVVSRPLSEMADIARNMARGDFSRKPLIYGDDEVGDLARALTHMSDELKIRIERIKQEGAKLDAVLSSMFEGIMVVNEAGAIALVNPSLKKIFFIDVECEGKKPLEVVRQVDVQDIVDQVLRGQDRLITREIIVNRPEEKVLKVNAVPVLRKEAVTGAVLVFHDITALRQLEKVRRDFVANVSHELRTPVSSIKGYAETLLEGALDDKENARDFVNIIYQDSNRLANLINDLLDLSRIESGKLEMAPTALDVKLVLERCLKVLDRPLKEKALSVELAIPEGLPKVFADERWLGQVFLNIIDNAVKYTPPNGSIRVKAATVDGELQVDISDTGIGIPEKDLSRLFERFYRVDRARSREAGGTGLGLSIVKHIIMAHNGQVWVTSELSRGSTFSFTLPLV